MDLEAGGAGKSGEGRAAEAQRDVAARTTRRREGSTPGAPGNCQQEPEQKQQQRLYAQRQDLEGQQHSAACAEANSKESAKAADEAEHEDGDRAGPPGRGGAPGEAQEGDHGATEEPTETPDGPISKRALRRALQNLRRNCALCGAVVRADKALDRSTCFCGGELSEPSAPQHGKHPGRLDSKAAAALLLLKRYAETQQAAVSPQGLRATARALRARATATEAKADLQDAETTWRAAEAEAQAALLAAPHVPGTACRRPDP